MNSATTSNQVVFPAAVIGGALAAAVNVALLFGAKAAGVTMTGVFDRRNPLPVELPLVAVIGASLVPSIVAAGVFAGLAKFTKSPRGAFGMLAAIGFVLSLGGPFSVAESSAATKVVMGLMHLVAAGSIAGMILRRTKDA